MARVYNWQLGREMSYWYPENRPKKQFAAVFDINKCIACQTCTLACKTTWTSGKGQEYMLWNNVESKPYGFYPLAWDLKLLEKLGGGLWNNGRYGGNTIYEAAPAGERLVGIRPAEQDYAYPNVGEDDCVYMRTVAGLARVDVIYRRIDDLFLDPEVFSPDSVLGVAGLMRAWRKGNVGLANAPGAGVADDKVVYTYVPDIIRYYLGEEAVLPNVPSYICSDPAQRKHVLENMAKLVVKPANESGGYGMLIGPRASRRQLEEFAQRIRHNPRNYMAQPLIQLSTAPTICESAAEPRHIDLRPFTLQGRDLYTTAGGLTRVALVKGSYVVNSSQGGGSKDTWVVS